MTDPRPKRRRWPWLLGGLALVIVAAALALPMLLDVERYRGLIEQALERSTGWDAELGVIDYSLAGGMVLQVAPASLRDPLGDGAVEIETIQVQASPWSLLQGKLSVQQIELVSPEIHIVRADEASGWSLPTGGGGAPSTSRPTEGVPAEDASLPNPSPPTEQPPGDGAGGNSGGAAGGGFDVEIQRVIVRNGRAVVEDRAADPAMRFGIEELSMDLEPTDQRLRARGTLLDDGGSFDGGGRWTEGLRFDVTNLTTEALHPFLGPDLVHAGGSLSGQLAFTPPFALQGEFDATNVLLLAGEAPLQRAALTFELEGGADDRLDLSSLSLTSGDAVLSGGGALAPDLAVDLALADSPLEDVLRAARAVFPFPLELEPPGRGSAQVALRMPAGEALTTEASGRLSAGGYRVVEFLPKAEELVTAFRLSKQGALEIDIESGSVAGGPLQGGVRLDSIEPMGTLTFDGGLEQTPLGALLIGFLGDPAEDIGGPSALNADLALNLGGSTVGVDALRGQLVLDSRNVSLPGWDLERRVAERIDEELAKLGGGIVDVIDKLSGGKVSEYKEEAAEQAQAGADTANEILQKLDVQVDFDNEPWHLQQLAFNGDSFQAQGDGTFSAVDGTIDLDLVLAFSPEKSASMVDRYSALKPLMRNGVLRIPVLLEGPMTAPAVGVDLQGAASGALGIDLSDDEQRKDAVKGLLRGLLGKDKDD